MKTNTKTQQKSIGKSDRKQSLEECKLERLKMTGAYGSASQAEAWAKGIETRQADIGCAVARNPKRSVPRRRPRLAVSRP